MGFTDGTYQPFESLVATSGLPVDKLNFVLCLLAAYPLGFVFRMIPTSQPAVRHAVGGIIGVLMCILCFREETLHLVMQGVLTMLCIKFGGSKSHLIVFWTCIAHLFAAMCYHRYMYWGDWALNVTGPLMILTEKMTQLAWAVHDGRMKKKGKLDKPFFEAAALDSEPTLLEVFGHTFFFANIMVGPNHQFKDYKEFIDGTGAHKTPPTNGTVTGLKKMLLAFLWHAWSMVPGLALGVTFSSFKLVSGPTFEGEPNPVNDYPVWKIVLFNYVSMVVYRCGFYFAWTLGEGANNIAGLGYKGKNADGSEDWSLLTNVKGTKVELATNLKEVLDEWNIGTAKWLRYVCYERLSKKQQPVYLTMLLSALWHGPYLGYWLSFATAALFTEGNRKIRYNIRPLFVDEANEKKLGKLYKPDAKHTLYNIIGWCCTICVLSYVTGPFVMLTADKSLAFWNVMVWHLHFIYIAIMVVLPAKKSPPKAKSDSTPPVEPKKEL